MGKASPAAQARACRRYRQSKTARGECRKCHDAIDILLSKIHCTKHHNEQNARSRRIFRGLKLLVYTKYGKKCACCGEAEFSFLTIDHIGGGGNKHRKLIGKTSSRIYRWLRNNNFPEGFQILCANCNQSKSQNGQCAHHQEV